MARVTFEEARKQMCPRCGAPAHTPCKRKVDGTHHVEVLRDRHHKDRIRAAKAAQPPDGHRRKP